MLTSIQVERDEGIGIKFDTAFLANSTNGKHMRDRISFLRHQLHRD